MVYIPFPDVIELYTQLRYITFFTLSIEYTHTKKISSILDVQKKDFMLSPVLLSVPARILPDSSTDAAGGLPLPFYKPSHSFRNNSIPRDKPPPVACPSVDSEAKYPPGRY
jgi:hypothetical protein